MTFPKYQPPATIQESEMRSKYMLFHTCNIMTVASMIFIFFGIFYFDFHQNIIPTSIFFIVFFLLSLLFAQHIIALKTAVNTYILAGSCFVIVSSYLSGGFSSPTMFWFILIPLYAFWMLDKKSAFIWFAFSILIPISFFVLETSNIHHTDPYSFYKGPAIFYALGINLFLGLNVFIIGYDFERKKQLAIDEINKQNNALSDALIQLEKTKQELQIAEKHKDNFISQMSHEMRTPMNAIAGIASLLNTNKKTLEDDLIEALDNSSKQLMYLIDDILDITKLQTGKFQHLFIKFNIVNVINATARIHKQIADKKNISLRLAIDKETPEYIMGDPYRVSQIITNILGNALKFTDSGTVTLKCQRSPDGSGLLLITEDTGIGMMDDEVSSLFNLFSQANPSIHLKYGGTGLGLSITKRLLEAFGGTISISSRVNEGTVVNIFLPHGNPENYELVVPKNETPEYNINDFSNLKILLAEDNPTNRKIFEKLIHSKVPDLEIVEAEHGNEALEYLISQPFDLVLMDIQMPFIDGMEVTRKIRASKESCNNKVKIIALTAYAGQNELENCLNCGMNDYMIKPFEIDVLLGKMYHLCIL